MRQGQGVIYGSKLQEGCISWLDLCNDGGALPTMSTCPVRTCLNRAGSLPLAGGWIECLLGSLSALGWLSNLVESAQAEWVCTCKVRDKLLVWEPHHNPGRHISWGLCGNCFLDRAGWWVVCTSVICSCPSSYLLLFTSPIGIRITPREQRLAKPDKVFPSQE